MAQMKCPRCGNPIDVTGKAAGSPVTCETCGNVASVTGSNRKVIYIIVGVVCVALCCPVVGIIAAIAIPNFIKFQARSKQSECKVNLKAWYTAQKSYFSENNAYDPVFSHVGFVPERGNRYAYFAGIGPVEDRSSGLAKGTEAAQVISVDTTGARASSQTITVEQLPPRLAPILGLSGECPECEITAACAANLDGDNTLDVWIISTGDLDMTDEDGTPAERGTPFHVVDDIRN